jgi:hypothetical protein
MITPCPKCASKNIEEIERYLAITHFTVRSLHQCNDCMKVFTIEKEQSR